MRRYELVTIISPQVGDDDVPDAVDRLIRRAIEGQGGVCEEVNVWGRRRLAYPIQKHVEGNYVLANFQLGPERARELEHTLRISEEVIRHLLVRLDE